MLLKAGEVYEIDVRNPILVSWRVKRYLMSTVKPRTRRTPTRIGKKCTAKSGRNEYTSLKLKDSRKVSQA